MNYYKVSLLRLGYAIVQAISREEAAEKAGNFLEEDIHWMEERDGLPAPYLVTVIELMDEAEN